MTAFYERASQGMGGQDIRQGAFLLVFHLLRKFP